MIELTPENSAKITDGAEPIDPADVVLPLDPGVRLYGLTSDDQINRVHTSQQLAQPDLRLLWIGDSSIPIRRA